MKSGGNNGKQQFGATADTVELLRIARTLRQPFTLDDLSVAAWKAHPKAYGMAGYSYPDKQKVHDLVYGTEGMIARAMLREPRAGLLCVPGEAEPHGNLH